MRRIAAMLTACWVAAAAISAEPDVAVVNGSPPEECSESPQATWADGYLTLKTTESFCLAMEFKGDELVLTAVTKPATAKDVLAFHFSRSPDGDLLVVHNGSDRVIKYRAEFQAGGTKLWRPTSICPVQAGIMGMEQWPHRIDADPVVEVPQGRRRCQHGVRLTSMRAK